jgi:sulfite reductase alpha subunit-like flavoprotein
LDINSVPRRSFFELLKFFTSDPSHTEKFTEFCTAEGQEDLWDYTARPRRTILEVLADFSDSLHIPPEYVLDVFPTMKARKFSIASARRGEVHLCVAIVRYKTNLKLPRWGVCSRYLAGLQEGRTVNCEVDVGTEIDMGVLEGGVRLPERNVPCVFVGPGTGVAPMRALIEERVGIGVRGISRDEHAEVDDLLVFGNRNRLKDFLFEEDWSKYHQSNGLFVATAFSRDSPAGEKKTYVQDVILRESKRIYDYLIRRNGVLFISGSSGNMPRGVKDAIVEIIKTEEGISHEEAKKVQQEMEKRGQWMQETW